jgi:hypothetical protein
MGKSSIPVLNLDFYIPICMSVNVGFCTSTQTMMLNRPESCSTRDDVQATLRVRLPDGSYSTPFTFQVIPGFEY